MSNADDNDQMDVDDKNNGEDDTYFEYDYELALPDVLKSISVKEKRELLAFKQSHNEIDWEGELVRRSDLLAKKIDLERLKRMTQSYTTADRDVVKDKPSKKTKAPAAKKAPTTSKKRRVLQEEGEGDGDGDEEGDEDGDEEGEEKDEISFGDDEEDDLFDSDEDKEILEKSKIKEKKRAPKGKAAAKRKKSSRDDLFDDDDEDDDIVDDRYACNRSIIHTCIYLHPLTNLCLGAW